MDFCHLLGNSLRLYYNSTCVHIEIGEPAISDLSLTLHNLKKEVSSSVTWKFSTPMDITHQFQQHCRLIEAAGGIVLSENKQHLLTIFRNGCWDLPKGKVEENEKIDIAAIREVSEETGLLEVSIINENPLVTYHLYTMEGNGNKAWVFKKTYWFKMVAKSTEILHPQQEEGIEKVQWQNQNEWKNSTGQSMYLLVKDLIHDALKW